MIQTSQIFAYENLSIEDIAAWRGPQAADPSLHSPYFSPDYVAAVAQVRKGVDVLRISQAEAPIGYLPFRRDWLGTGRPIAGPMDDIHGVITASDTRLSLTNLMSNLKAYSFSAVPFTQRRHGLCGAGGDGNQVIDLSRGYQAWFDQRSTYSSAFRREARKVQTLLDRPGTLIAHDVVDPAAFSRLLRLKQTALNAAGHFNIFQLDWPQTLLETLQSRREAPTRGLLSTLHLEGKPAAYAYCMRSEQVLHYWFPAYEAEFASLKPGLALLFSLAKWASLQGMRELHLGLGDAQYKRHMASWMAPVRRGTLAVGLGQRLATHSSAWFEMLEGHNRFMDLPAKYVRKYQRAMLAGTPRA